jgi:hypothetical protein
VAVGIKYGTVGVLDRQRTLHEVTTFRRDVATDGRHAVVQYGVSLEDDLARRDFTINAIAYHPLRREWRDPFRGKQDLDAGLVRAVGSPALRFAEDYLRILRALRFAARFDFAIDAETWTAALACSSSPESGCGTSGSRGCRPRSPCSDLPRSGATWARPPSGSRSSPLDLSRRLRLQSGIPSCLLPW